MKPIYYQAKLYGFLLTASLLGYLFVGCTTVGPSSIKSGRLSYNEAIAQTNNQQMLMTVIKNRYEETGNLLAVASVTANVRIATSTGIQLGFGDAADYAGNLVPFGAGAVYEENPTISYIPVAGAHYTRQVFSPAPISVLAQLTGTLADPAYIYKVLISSINGIPNPDFLFPSTEIDPRFSRIVMIMTKLSQVHCLHWIENSQHVSSYSIVIDRYAPVYAAEVDELLKLLGLPKQSRGGTRVILPVVLALDGRDSKGVGITTRSVADLMEILSAAIKVPEEDVVKGVAAVYPSPGLVGKDLRVDYSQARPEHATVAVPFRNGWFYIDETDQTTKKYFRLMSALWSVSIADSAADGSARPVLTVPVSR
jgi:hypothetical protein